MFCNCVFQDRGSNHKPPLRVVALKPEIKVLPGPWRRDGVVGRGEAQCPQRDDGGHGRHGHNHTQNTPFADMATFSHLLIFGNRKLTLEAKMSPERRKGMHTELDWL